ncbi:MAG: hypothetical protein P8Z79_22505 [Sedimentisphaerales bacterium]|jgi:hypothetical protein
MQANEKTRKRINKSRICAYVISACALIHAGCSRPYRAEPTGQIQLSHTDKAESMKLAEDVLSELHFPIDKADVESGLLTTRPLPGAQFFEFWRGDNVGAGNGLQANLHTIRRTVEVDVTQRADKVCVSCSVKVQQLSLPEREITNSAGVYDMFSSSTPVLQKIAMNPEQRKAATWIDLADDKALAAEILKRIERRTLHRTDNDKQMTGTKT